jgi:hypothetical protein
MTNSNCVKCGDAQATYETHDGYAYCRPCARGIGLPMETAPVTVPWLDTYLRGKASGRRDAINWIRKCADRLFERGQDSAANALYSTADEIEMDFKDIVTGERLSGAPIALPACPGNGVRASPPGSR